MISHNVYDVLGVVPPVKLPRYTSLGSYPIVYYGPHYETLCDLCASLPEERTYTAAILWEGPGEDCEGCGCHIDSAYGEE